MIKKSLALFLCFCITVLFGGCYETYQLNDSQENSLIIFTDAPTEEIILTETESDTEQDSETESEFLTESETQNFALPEDETLPDSVEKDGSYTSPEDVAEYIHTFGTLPSNFITKKEAQNLGWDSSAGNLWDVAEGKSIGGDKFGNREGLLPEGNYHECDVNYQGGYRGAERLIYSDSGEIYYTDDHYKTFTQLY
ncbi:MAG: ribonuclease [Oscillospiraceae bacterium]|nr:ribonuclease [Oscillospiraceae bacterium]